MMDEPGRERTLRTIILVAFAMSGGAALIYEVVWTRKLTTVMGSSTYALSAMLGAFMAGLSLGGWLGSRLLRRKPDAVTAFALTEFCIAISGLLLIPLIEHLTPLYIKTYYAFHLSFNAFSAVQFVLCFMTMAVPTTLMGMTFPLVVQAINRPAEAAGAGAGRAYSINTLGAILGSVSAGFILIPLLGTRWTVVAAALLNLGASLAILVLRKRARTAGAVITVFVAAIFVYTLAATPWVPFFSYYSANRFSSSEHALAIYDYLMRDDKMREGLIMYSRNGSEGNVVVTQAFGPGARGRFTLINGGKLEAGDDDGFALLADLPYYSFGGPGLPGRALNIGLGSGRTLTHLTHLEGLKRIDSLEINDAIIEANRTVMSPWLFGDPRVNHIAADGRNYLLVTKETYDLIIISPSWAVETASAGLLTDEFFGIAKSRLSPDGVIALWIDHFIETPEDLRIIARTVSHQFSHSRVWTLPSASIIVATNSGRQRSEADVMAGIEGLDSLLAGIVHIGFQEDKIRALPPGPINTDEYPIIEFNNARNIIIGTGNRKTGIKKNG